MLIYMHITLVHCKILPPYMKVALHPLYCIHYTDMDVGHSGEVNPPTKMATFTTSEEICNSCTMARVYVICAVLRIREGFTLRNT